MKLIVGLGNPGSKYTWTRHNVGWLMIDSIVSRLSLGTPQIKFKGEFWGNISYGQDKISFLKPHTYMNLSGMSVAEAVRYQNIDLKDILVIYDDIALPFGRLRIREKGSAGGQKGMSSIIDNLKTNEIDRLRIGIDAPLPNIDVADWVLGTFPKEQMKSWHLLEDIVWQSLELWLDGDIQKAMSKINTLKV
ncbi:MAG: aminoacyl-tRNA hydrolase [Synergistaceae bacterium]